MGADPASIAMIALTAASTAYSVSQAGNKPDMPKMPETPTQPVSPAIDINVQNRMAQEQAESAGGTILSKTQGEGTGNPAMNPASQPKKSLLGN